MTTFFYFRNFRNGSSSPVMSACTLIFFFADLQKAYRCMKILTTGKVEINISKHRFSPLSQPFRVSCNPRQSSLQSKRKKAYIRFFWVNVSQPQLGGTPTSCSWLYYYKFIPFAFLFSSRHRDFPCEAASRPGLQKPQKHKHAKKEEQAFLFCVY